MDAFQSCIENALLETLTHVFKCSYPHLKLLKIEGLVAVTADSDVVIVHVDECYDLSGDGSEEIEKACPLRPSRDALIKTEPTPPDKPPKNDPSILALLEHFQTIKKENHTNISMENTLSSSLLLTRHYKEDDGEQQLPQPEFFYEDENWNARESSLEEEQIPIAHNEYLSNLDDGEYVCRKLLKKRSRRNSLMDPRDRGEGGGGEGFIITESSHICAYPNCYKRFKLRRNLLRHQTNKHGRIPVRRRKGEVSGIAFDGEEEEEEEQMYGLEEGGEGYIEDGSGLTPPLQTHSRSRPHFEAT